jgi:hypothetical protein
MGFEVVAIVFCTHAHLIFGIFLSIHLYINLPINVQLVLVSTFSILDCTWKSMAVISVQQRE